MPHGAQDLLNIISPASCMHAFFDHSCLTWVIENGVLFCWQECSRGWTVGLFEVVTDLLHCHPFNAFEFVDVFNHSLHHHQCVGMPTNIWVSRHGEYEPFWVLSLEVVKVIYAVVSKSNPTSKGSPHQATALPHHVDLPIRDCCEKL